MRTEKGSREANETGKREREARRKEKSIKESPRETKRETIVPEGNTAIIERETIIVCFVGCPHITICLPGAEFAGPKRVCGRAMGDRRCASDFMCMECRISFIVL